MNKTYQTLIKARTALILDAPFYGSLALRLELKLDESNGTAWTDSKTIGFNPAFVDSIPFPQLKGVMAHEIMHCALQHTTRRGDRDPETWNIAADYAINPILVDAGFDLPTGALIDPRFCGLSVDRIYSTLEAERKQCRKAPDSTPQRANGQHGQNPQPAIPDPGKCGSVVDAAPENSAAQKELQHEWNIAVQQAAQYAAGCGKLPGAVQRAVQDSRRETMPWQAILRDYMQSYAPSDYTFSPCNRRYVHQGVYLPSCRAASLGEIVLAFDTSGSIGADTINRFFSEFLALTADLPFEKMHVVYCDARVQSTLEFDRYSAPERLEPVGGGGTSYLPVFDWLDEQGITPAVLLYFTDLDCRRSRMPAAEQGFPVLWLASDIGYYDAITSDPGYADRLPPFGAVIPLE